MDTTEVKAIEEGLTGNLERAHRREEEEKIPLRLWKGENYQKKFINLLYSRQFSYKIFNLAN